MTGQEIFDRVNNTHDHVTLCRECHRLLRAHITSSMEATDAWNRHTAAGYSVRVVETHDECLMKKPEKE